LFRTDDGQLGSCAWRHRSSRDSSSASIGVGLRYSVSGVLQNSKPPLLAIWGKNDPFFIPPGAEAFKRDIPNATVRFLDTGHFALETHVEEIAVAVRELLGKNVG
jgi:pimeloyl-ACP methyl ester carboxylesterase